MATGKRKQKPLVRDGVEPNAHARCADCPLGPDKGFVSSWRLTPTEVDEQTRRAHARALVAILLGAPQAAVNAAEAVQSGSAVLRHFVRAETPDDRPAPITYRVAAELYSALDAEARISRGAKTPPRRSSKPASAVIDGRTTPVRHGGGHTIGTYMPGDIQPPISRPGTGGRRRPVEAEKRAAEAIKAICERLGAPVDSRKANTGRTMLFDIRDTPSLALSEGPSFDLEEAPRVILYVRISRDEEAKGRGVINQINDGLRLCERLHLRVVYVVVAWAVSGRSDWKDRADLHWIQELIVAGGVKGVFAREPDRVGRKALPVETFYEFLRDHDVDLYLGHVSGKIDWDKDGIRMALEGALSEAEGKKIVQRLQSGLRRAWLEEGRGWPTSVRFGFKRADDGFVEWDEEAWWVVEKIHYGYATAVYGRHVGHNALHYILKDEGVDISRDRIRIMCKDSMPVDGRYTVNDRGLVVECELARIPEDRRIPRAVFQHNQELMAVQKGPSAMTPPGTYIGNSLNLRHASCEHLEHPQYGQSKIKGRTNTGRARYRHTGWAPKLCRGRTWPLEAIEHPIIEAALNALTNPDVITEWIEAGRTGEETVGPLYKEDRVQKLRNDIRNLKNSWAKEDRDLKDRLLAGEEVTRSDRRWLDSIDESITAKEKELDDAASLPRAEQIYNASRGSLPEDLIQAAREILTLDTPEDPRMRLRRAAAVLCVFSGGVIHDTDDGVEIELFGPLVPTGAEIQDRIKAHPIEQLKPLLAQYVAERDGIETVADTCVQPSHYTQVFEIWATGGVPKGKPKLDLEEKLRFRARSGIPIFKAPAIKLVCKPARPAGLFGPDDYVAWVRRAQEARPPRRVLNERGLHTFMHAHPEGPTGHEILTYVKRDLGLTFGVWRNQILPNPRCPEGVFADPLDHWTLRRACASVQDVAERLAPVEISFNAYRKVAKNDETLCPYHYMVRFCEAVDMSLGAFIRAAAVPGRCEYWPMDQQLRGLELRPRQEPVPPSLEVCAIGLRTAFEVLRSRSSEPVAPEMLNERLYKKLAREDSRLVRYGALMHGLQVGGITFARLRAGVLDDRVDWASGLGRMFELIAKDKKARSQANRMRSATSGRFADVPTVDVDLIPAGLPVRLSSASRR
jgi:DNA invertase Pin-like site-specific DNA recombinase